MLTARRRWRSILSRHSFGPLNIRTVWRACVRWAMVTICVAVAVVWYMSYTWRLVVDLGRPARLPLQVIGFMTGGVELYQEALLDVSPEGWAQIRQGQARVSRTYGDRPCSYWWDRIDGVAKIHPDNYMQAWLPFVRRRTVTLDCGDTCTCGLGKACHLLGSKVRQTSVWIPYWMGEAGMVSLTVYLFVRAHKRRRRARCVTCGYLLYGNTSGRCPECGTGILARAVPEPVQNVDPPPIRSVDRADGKDGEQ